MTTSFELIDFETGNLVGSSASEEEAQAIARHASGTNDAHEVRVLGLLRVRGDDQELVAEGTDSVGETRPAAGVNPVVV